MFKSSQAMREKAKGFIMFEENASVETQEVAEPVQEENTQVEPVQNASEEVVEPQQDDKPVQSADDNAKYASIRRQAQQEAQEQTTKAVDAEYSRLYGDSHGIHSKADFDDAIAQQEREAQIQAEAQQQGVSEEYARRLRDLEDSNNSTKAEKAEYQRQLAQIKEHETLSKDETFSEYYNEHLDEIKESASNFGVDLTTAMLLSIKDNFGSIVKGSAAKASQDTINNIIKNGKSSPGALGGGGEQQSSAIDAMSSEDFNKLTDRVLRGEKIKF